MNIPMPNDPELLESLGISADGDQNYISVYPAELSSKELDIVITENPVTAEQISEMDVSRRASPERNQVGDGNAVLSRTRIDFSGENPSYEYPFSEDACSGDAVYTFSQLPQGASARSYCSEESTGDRFAKADRSFYMCAKTLEFECKMPLFGFDYADACWSGNADGWSDNVNTRECLQSMFALDGPVEGATDTCGNDSSGLPADEAERIDRAVETFRYGILNQELNRVMLRESDGAYTVRGLVRPERYDQQRNRTMGPIVESLPHFGEINSPAELTEFLAALDAADGPRAQAIRQWLDSRAEEERRRMTAEAASQSTLAGDNDEQFFGVRRQLLLMMAMQTDATYSGGFVSGDTPIDEPVGQAQVTVDQAIQALNQYMFVENGDFRSLSALGNRDQAVKPNDFCAPSERSRCRQILTDLLASNGLNEMDVYPNNLALEVAGAHGASNPTCAAEEVPETGNTVEEEVQAVSEATEGQSTEGLVDPSRRLLTYINGVTAMCRALSFANSYRELEEGEQVDEQFIRTLEDGTRLVPLSPSYQYDQETR
ncbi:MAG: hypothetical protein AAF202_01160 [Pseudomonadota bacterium]